MKKDKQSTAVDDQRANRLRSDESEAYNRAQDAERERRNPLPEDPADARRAGDDYERWLWGD